MTNALVASAVDPDVSASLQIYEEMKSLKDALGVRDLTDQELQLFAMVARHTGLDPFTKQIYAIKRQGRVSHQTGIDGYRSAAERTGQYAGSDEAVFEECDCGQEPKGHPKLARVVVHRILVQGAQVDQVGIARWHELYPGSGDVGQMWRKMPLNQLAKCAEANGLRKAFPRVFGGVYITDEMQGAETVDGQAREVTRAPQPTTRDRLAARREASEAKGTTAATPASEPTGEVEGEASWIDTAAAAPAQATVLDDVDLAATLLTAAQSSDLEGPATREQLAALGGIFTGWDSEIVKAGIRIVFGPDAVGKPTAAQAGALVLVADSLGDRFPTLWGAMVAGQAVAS